MASIQEAVLKNKADLGVIFDTDVDRAAVVAKSGQVINRNNLIAVLAQIVLENNPGQTIVTNSPTSSHLKDFIEELGGKQVRYLCGYRNVINKAVQLNEAGIETPLAIETSGHAAFKENYFLDDGAYVIAKILMLLPKLKAEGKNLSELIEKLKQPVEAQEVRFKISGDDYRVYGESVIENLHHFVSETDGFTVDPENDEGIRVNTTDTYGSGWFLLRMSLHEPLLVLQVENDVADKNKLVFTKLREYFVKQDRLNTEKLLEILK
jgi:phosphomannomutase